jgi:hypothetical protein
MEAFRSYLQLGKQKGRVGGDDNYVAFDKKKSLVEKEVCDRVLL